ncbi:hypothetical protein ACIQPQ_26135 [Streptomyces sp. NPDC091281]|uniref:hypothetical protein n=1 Tax=Streptomyces sp. NPDC091281 TaxID=3365985 RepID=UPI003807F636
MLAQLAPLTWHGVCDDLTALSLKGLALNEGCAFQQEDLLISVGLFDDAPHSALTIVEFLRLRVVRAEVDIGLATGQPGSERPLVLMDRRTAWEEAVFYAGNPGRALSHHVGKSQINELIAHLPSDVDLRDLHRRLGRRETSAGAAPLGADRSTRPPRPRRHLPVQPGTTS